MKPTAPTQSTEGITQIHDQIKRQHHASEKKQGYQSDIWKGWHRVQTRLKQPRKAETKPETPELEHLVLRWCGWLSPTVAPPATMVTSDWKKGFEYFVQ